MFAVFIAFLFFPCLISAKPSTGIYSIFSPFFYNTHLTNLFPPDDYFAEGPLPSFTWVVSEEIDNLPIVNLKIDFNDGGLPDVAQLNRNHNGLPQDEEDSNNECILSGYLRDEDDIPVTVSGCFGSNTFQVMIYLSAPNNLNN